MPGTAGSSGPVAMDGSGFACKLLVADSGAPPLDITENRRTM